MADILGIRAEFPSAVSDHGFSISAFFGGDWVRDKRDRSSCLLLGESRHRRGAARM